MVEKDKPVKFVFFNVSLVKQIPHTLTLRANLKLHVLKLLCWEFICSEISAKRPIVISKNCLDIIHTVHLQLKFYLRKGWNPINLFKKEAYLPMRNLDPINQGLNDPNLYLVNKGYC